MAEERQAVYQQRVLGYPCIFTRTVDEASASIIRAITADLLSDGPDVWLKRIEEWLDHHEPLTELNWSGAEFSEAEWRTILAEVVAALRRHLTIHST